MGEIPISQQGYWPRYLRSAGPEWSDGAGDGSRTRDLSFTKAVLYQLSYASKEPAVRYRWGRIAISSGCGNRPLQILDDFTAVRAYEVVSVSGSRL